MQDDPIVLGFTAGELSPWLSTRIDLQQYHRGAARLENFSVQPYGGLQRRRGTQFVAEAAAQEDSVKLFAFSYSVEDNLLLEFFPSGLRFYKEKQLLRDSAGEVYVLKTPWDTAEKIHQLRLIQTNDVIYATCPLTPPMVLKRYAETDWRCEEMVFEPYPRATSVAQEGSLYVECALGSTEASLTSDELCEPFREDMEGREYIVAEATIPSRVLFLNEGFATGVSTTRDLSIHSIKKGDKFYILDSAVNTCRFFRCVRDYSPDYYMGSKQPEDYPSFFEAGIMWMYQGYPYEVCGDWELCTSGTWTSQWELRRSYDTLAQQPDVTKWQWSLVKNYYQNGYTERKNWAFSGHEESPCRFIIVCMSCLHSNVPAAQHLRLLGGKRSYTMKIKSVQGPHHATAEILSSYIPSALSFSTRQWSFGAFGPSQGYPRFSAMHHGRLWFGGTKAQPTTLRASVVDDFYNFQMGSQSDSALHLTLASDDQSRICWLSSARQLLLGTTDGEWTLSSSDNAPLSATNASFNRQSSVGGENKEAYNVENSVFYVQRGGKRLREISYKLEADGYTSTDTSLFAEHLFGAGVKEWAVQRGGSSHVWVLMNDGSLAVLTSSMEQQVTAWNRVSLPQAEVLHLVSLPCSGNLEDEVWLVVRRETGDGPRITIERLVDSDLYLDCAVECPVLEGRVQHPLLRNCELLCYPQGKAQQAQRILLDALGQAACEGEGTQVLGLPFESIMVTMPLEHEGRFNAVCQHGRVKLRVLESASSFDFKASHMDAWEHLDSSRMHLPECGYTGAIRLSQLPKPGVGQGFSLRYAGPHAFNLLSLSLELDYHGK